MSMEYECVLDLDCIIRAKNSGVQPCSGSSWKLARSAENLRHTAVACWPDGSILDNLVPAYRGQSDYPTSIKGPQRSTCHEGPLSVYQAVLPSQTYTSSLSI